jgi:general secretion pathway protein H
LRCAGQTGFTLLEILVVLLIIGILTTVAVLSSGIVSDDRELEKSGQNREYGIALTIEGYEFVMFDNFTGQWLLFPPDDLFRPRNLPEEIEFGLTVEDRDILLPRNRVDPEIEPHIIFYASGEQTPFEIRIARRYQDDTYVITGDLTGKIEDQQPNEES